MALRKEDDEAFLRCPERFNSKRTHYPVQAWRKRGFTSTFGKCTERSVTSCSILSNVYIHDLI